MNFLQRTPYFRILFAFATGIVLFQFIQFPLSLLATFLSLAIALIIVSFLIQKSNQQYTFRALFGIGTFIILFVSGHFLCWNFERNHQFSALNVHSTYETELIATPVEKAKSYLCKVRLIQQKDSDAIKACNGNAIIYLQKDSAVSKLLPGDRLIIDAEFKSPDGVQNPDGFDYAKYLNRQGIKATAYVSTDKWQKSNAKYSFSYSHPILYYVRTADKCRKYLLNIYRTYNITGDEFAVLAALTLGYTDDLQPDLLKSYSATGAMHILSVSGLHVGIIYAVMLFLFGFLSKNQRQKIIKTIIIVLFLWIYAFITGLSPAVLRATLMFSVMTVGVCLDWKSQIYNTIFASAFLILLFNPNLIFDIGFQLSYSAVLSIVFFQPQISVWFSPKQKAMKWGWSLIAVSLAAQLGTAPFVLYYFHQFPNFFLLTNLVAIPLSTIVIYLAIALLMFSFIPYFSLVIAILLKWSLWLLNYSIVSIQNMPFSISSISMDTRQLIFAFLAIAFLSAYFYNKKFLVLTIGLSSVLLVCSIYSLQKYKSLTTSELIVFSDSKIPIINFIDKGKNYVFTTDSAQSTKIAGPYWKSNLLNSPEYIKNKEWFNDGFAVFQNKRIIILKDNLLKNKTPSSAINVDYLILSNKLKPKMEEILSCVHPKMVIVDKSISKWYTNNAKEICAAHNINFYSIAEKGAFRVKFQ